MRRVFPTKKPSPYDELHTRESVFRTEHELSPLERTPYDLALVVRGAFYKKVRQ